MAVRDKIRSYTDCEVPTKLAKKPFFCGFTSLSTVLPKDLYDRQPSGEELGWLFERFKVGFK